MIINEDGSYNKGNVLYSLLDVLMRISLVGAIIDIYNAKELEDAYRMPTETSLQKGERREAIRRAKKHRKAYARVLCHYDGNQLVCDSGAEEFIEINSKTVNRTSTLPGTSGANGVRAQMPYIYLFPYRMARYHGLIGD